MIIALLPLALFTACEKEDDYGLDSYDFGDGQAMQPTTIPAGNAEVTVASRYFEEAVNNEGKNYYKHLGYVPVGESVRLKGGATPTDIKYDGSNYRIAPAQLADGRNVFISIWYLMPGQRKAVVTAPKTAVIYDGLKPADITSYTIPRGTIIAVVNSEPGSDRQQFVAYQVAQPIGKKVSFGLWEKYYIESSYVSTNQNDFDMMETIEKIKKLDKGLWATAIENAIKSYGDSVFVSDAQALLSGEGVDGSGSRPTEDASFSGIITEADVNVRDEPNEKLENVIGKLDKGQVVQIRSQTTDTYTISGQKSRWYYVEGGGIAGWIFGYFIEKEEK